MIDPNLDSGIPGTGMSEEHERARVLADVMRDQARRAAAAGHEEGRRDRQFRVRRVVLLATWVAVAYVWLGSPSWLRVQPPEKPTVFDEARALRVNVFLQSQKIEAYRQSRGRLPWVLEEAGPPFAGIQYQRKDNRFYELHGISDRVDLRYESEHPPLDFLGAAGGLLDPHRTGDRQ